MLGTYQTNEFVVLGLELTGHVKFGVLVGVGELLDPSIVASTPITPL